MPNKIFSKEFAGSEIIVEINLDKDDQELISDLTGHNFISKNIDGQIGIVVHMHERPYYNFLLNVLSNYENIRIKEVEHSLE